MAHKQNYKVELLPTSSIRMPDELLSPHHPTPLRSPVGIWVVGSSHILDQTVVFEVTERHTSAFLSCDCTLVVHEPQTASEGTHWASGTGSASWLDEDKADGTPGECIQMLSLAGNRGCLASLWT